MNIFEILNNNLTIYIFLCYLLGTVKFRNDLVSYNIVSVLSLFLLGIVE